MNSEILKFQARIIGFQMMFLVILGVVFALFLQEPKSYMMGLVFGGAIGALNFRMMGISMEKTVKMAPHTAQINAGIHYFIRMFIYGAVLFIAVKADYLSILTTALGLISIKIVIIGLNFLKIKF